MQSKQPEEKDAPLQRNQGWVNRFSVAFRGVKIAVLGEPSFYVHLLVTAIVLSAGAGLGLSRWEWCLVVLCIATVLCAELFNTSLERISLAITREEDANIRDALDIASGAVLVSACGAAVVGMLVFGARVVEMLDF